MAYFTRLCCFVFGFAEGLNGIAAEGLKAKWRYLYANDWFAFAKVINATVGAFVANIYTNTRMNSIVDGC